jgi:hypothetical protein
MTTCATPPSQTTALISRHLHLNDIPALLQLEGCQWNSAQSASADVLRQRLLARPQFSVGTFCADTGQALTSLFMKPIDPAQMRSIRSWDDCAKQAQVEAPTNRTRSLFGISLTSINPMAVRHLESYIWPLALQAGWQEIYLGSPMPGLHNALRQDPTMSVMDYACAKRRGLPRDAQLRYYHRKGLREIIAVLPGYFPHAQALDYGVLLRGNLHEIAVTAVKDAV